MKSGRKPTRQAQLGAIAGILLILALVSGALGSVQAGVSPLAAPNASIIYPVTNTVINSRTPLIEGTIFDTGTGVNVASISLKLDGVTLTGVVYDSSTGLLTCQIPTTMPLTLADHTLTLDVTDNAAVAAPTQTVYFRVSMPELDAGLHMFSLPFTYTASTIPTPTDVFGPNVAKMARWWTGDSQYHIYPDAYGSFSPPDALGSTAVVQAAPAGLAYFVSLSSAVTLNITGTPITNPAAYPIRLTTGQKAPTGWNMIGDPFTSSVAWSSVQFVTNGVTQSLTDAVAAGVTDGVLFSFTSTSAGGYYSFPADPFAASLDPFQGYWLNVQTNTTLLLSPPAITGSAVRAAGPAPLTSAPDAWRLQLVVAAAGLEDPCHYVGQSSLAPAGYSPRSAVMAPPAVDSRLTACLVESDWGAHSGSYAQIIKPAAGKQSWNLEVTCRVPQTPVSLSWPELNSGVPAGTTLTLQDLDNGQEVSMRTAAGYSFNSGTGGVRHLLITAGPAGSASSLTLTGVTAQAAPGGMAFTYALSEPATVTAEVRNLSGVLVKSLTVGQSAAGAVELLVWNGRNEYGSRVPAGRYIVNIIARTDSGQTAQAIRPFEVNP